MEHDWTNLLSITFKVDQSDFYCWFSQVTTAPGLPLMRGRALGVHPCLVAAIHRCLTKLLPKKVTSEATENP